MRAVFSAAVSVTVEFFSAAVTSQMVKRLSVRTTVVSLPPVPATFVRTKHLRFTFGFLTH